jgi:hypothetical protein
MNEAAVPAPFIEPAAPELARVVTSTGTGEAVGVFVGVTVAVLVTVGGRATGAVRLEDFVHDRPKTNTVKRTVIPIHFAMFFIRSPPNYC